LERRESSRESLGEEVKDRQGKRGEGAARKARRREKRRTSLAKGNKLTPRGKKDRGYVERVIREMRRIRGARTDRERERDIYNTRTSSSGSGRGMLLYLIRLYKLLYLYKT
jgi:hypothetical protein